MTLELNELNLNRKDKRNVLATLKDGNNKTIFVTLLKAILFQDAPRCSKMLQDVPRCFKMLQDAPRCSTLETIKRISFNNVKIKEV